MSNTDKTRPWWVRVADTPMLTCVPVHDHRFGPCSLPDEPTADSVSDGHPVSGCHWRVTRYYAFGRSGGSDGCRDCTGYHERREQRRRSRHQARRELRDYDGKE